MYIELVEIDKFRLIQKMALRLNPGMNMLAGENDSGKTALVDAIKLVLGTNATDRYFVTEKDFWDDCDCFSISLKIVNLGSFDHMFLENITYEDGAVDVGNSPRLAQLYVNLRAEKTNRERRGRPLIKTTWSTGKNFDGPPLEAEARDFLAATYLRPLRDAESELSAGKGSRLAQILASAEELRVSPDKILKIVADANDAFLADGEPLAKVADRIQERFFRELVFTSDRSKLSPVIDIAGVRADQLPHLTDAEKKRFLRNILEQLSLHLDNDRKLHGLGYNNLLFIAAELLLLEQERTDTFPLLLLEEPEAHIHPQLQMKLLKFIQSKVQSEKNTDGAQCIMTTHSPNLSSKADIKDVIMMDQGKAWPFRMDECEALPDDFFFMSKFLDATKANIFFARGLLFVEGVAEQILLPVLARLLGQSFEDEGVSIIQYNNSGSWKRFARLFLRKGADNEPTAQHPMLVGVMRDLDLWPDCAEEKAGNAYGFKKKTAKNRSYWLSQCTDQHAHREKLKGGLERQNIRIFVSDDWTFEYCLAKHGLFAEACQAVRKTNSSFTDPEGSADEKATAVLKAAAKSDFAYHLAAILEQQQKQAVKAAVDAVPDDDNDKANSLRTAIVAAEAAFARELRGKLPRYVLAALDYVSRSTGAAAGDE